MNTFLLTNGFVVTEKEIIKAHILIENQRISSISNVQPKVKKNQCQVIDVEGMYIFPGIIDTHVHFREPGLTHKATFVDESIAAVAGGVTSVIDMPNTIPYANSLVHISEKKRIAKKNSLVNTGFYIGADKRNIQEIVALTNKDIAGIKVFIGSSTGNVILNDDTSLASLFAEAKLPIVVHAEDDNIIQQNLIKYKELYHNDIPFRCHSEIRNEEACFSATQKVIALAKKYGSQLHILHISTAKELELFDTEKFASITAEVCLPHLWFSDEDYTSLQGKIKCNPSVKSKNDREALRKALHSDKIFTIGTDHAPHTLDEKNKSYLDCPSGIPFIQHSLISILELERKGYLTLQHIVQKMAQQPALRFHIMDRGFIKPGYFADLAIIDTNASHIIKPSDILYKCGWSPLLGERFTSSVVHTFVNGNHVFDHGKIFTEHKGLLLEYY